MMYILDAQYSFSLIWRTYDMSCSYFEFVASEISPTNPPFVDGPVIQTTACKSAKL